MNRLKREEYDVTQEDFDQIMDEPFHNLLKPKVEEDQSFSGLRKALKLGEKLKASYNLTLQSSTGSIDDYVWQEGFATLMADSIITAQ